MNNSIEISTINQPPLSRDQYGALNLPQVLPPELQAQVAAFLDAAVAAGYLPAPYFTSSKNAFKCLNLDIYDVLVFRGKVKSLVVQARTFSKETRKGYSSSGKEYYLATRSGRKITAQPLEKATCVKRAKNTTALGQLVEHYIGKTTVVCKKPNVPVRTGFKVLFKTADGRLVSAFDGSEYPIGKWRSQAARPDHGGGFYYYMDEAPAIDATKRGVTFAESVDAGNVLVLCKVEIKGREIGYGGWKWAASQLRVITELMPVVID